MLPSTRLSGLLAVIRFLLAAYCPGVHLLDGADVEERLLGDVIEVAIDERLERLDRLGDRHVLALEAGEHLGDEERLGQESLHLPRPIHREPVLLGQLVETEDGDDVLQLLVALQGLLDAAGHVVVALARRPRATGSSTSTASGSTAG